MKDKSIKLSIQEFLDDFGRNGVKAVCLKDSELLSKAILISSFIHLEQRDKGGHPYQLHCLRVMDSVKHFGARTQMAAVLHDSIEDGARKMLRQLPSLFGISGKFSNLDTKLPNVNEQTEECLNLLGEIGFPKEVTDAISLLTKREVRASDQDEHYYNYISAIGDNLIATRVKMADITDNSQVTRLKGVSERDKERVDKYNKSFLYLSMCETRLKNKCQ